MARLAAKYQGTELESRIDVREEWRQIYLDASVFEVENAAYAPGGGNGFEESSSSLVGVNSGWCQQTYKSVLGDQVHSSLYKQRIDIDVTPPEERIVAGSAEQMAQVVGPGLGVVEVVGECISPFAKPPDSRPSCRRCRSQS